MLSLRITTIDLTISTTGRPATAMDDTKNKATDATLTSSSSFSPLAVEMHRGENESPTYCSREVCGRFDKRWGNNTLVDKNLTEAQLGIGPSVC